MNETNFKKNKLVLPHQPYHDVFLETMTKILRLSRWFGVMGPGFRLCKAWSVLLFSALIAVEIGGIWKVIKALAGWAVDTAGHRSVTARLSGTIFYSSAIASLLLSSKFSLSWESLHSFWVTVERAVHVNIPPDKQLRKRMLTAVIGMIACSTLEHTMSVMSLVGFDCPKHLILKRYMLKSHGFLFLNQDYSEWIAIPIIIISNIATILWNFQDTLIVLVCLGLTSRYKRLNRYVAKLCKGREKKLKDKSNDVVNVSNWRKIREAYVKQAALVRKVDTAIGSLILLSSFGNFYFICLQLFLGITQGLSGAPGLKMAYYLISLTWLLRRFIWMVLAAADVNEQSTLALRYLHSCSSSTYNVEIARLHNQLRKDYVALSGMGFYSINRSILLKMAASVVTYELVLIQFDNKGSDH